MTHLAGVDAYRAALAESLKALICPGDENEAFVVRAVAKFGHQLGLAGRAARDLIAELLRKDGSDCPFAGSLTDADLATLLNIKQKITSVEKLGG